MRNWKRLMKHPELISVELKRDAVYDTESEKTVIIAGGALLGTALAGLAGVGTATSAVAYFIVNERKAVIKHIPWLITESIAGYGFFTLLAATFVNEAQYKESVIAIAKNYLIADVDGDIYGYRLTNNLKTAVVEANFTSNGPKVTVDLSNYLGGRKSWDELPEEVKQACSINQL